MKVAAMIGQWIDHNIFHHVVEKTKADAIWKKLEAEKNTSKNKDVIIKKLVNLKYRERRSMTEHTSEYQGLVNQLTTMQMMLADEMQALLLLSSLLDSQGTLRGGRGSVLQNRTKSKFSGIQ